jgi:hypothetical protein
VAARKNPYRRRDSRQKRHRPLQVARRSFDLVWVFDLPPDGKYLFNQVPQMLLAGDLPVSI